MLGRLFPHIYFQHDTHLFSRQLQPFLQLSSQLKPIHRLHHIETLNRIFRLVGLQTSDEVPLPTHGHFWNLHFCLLDPILPKKPMS